MWSHRQLALRIGGVRYAAQLGENLNHAVQMREPWAVAVDEFVEHEFAFDHVFARVVDFVGQAIEVFDLHATERFGGFAARGLSAACTSRGSANAPSVVAIAALTSFELPTLNTLSAIFGPTPVTFSTSRRKKSRSGSVAKP